MVVGTGGKMTYWSCKFHEDRDSVLFNGVFPAHTTGLDEYVGLQKMSV